MEDEEREMLFAIADQIQLTNEGAKMHPKIIAHRRTITEWNKNNNKIAGSYLESRYNSEPNPVFSDVVSEKSIPRVFRILDTLIHVMEPLGCTLNDDLKFIIRDEIVSIQFSEAKDEIKHINTKEENIQLLKYEEDRNVIPMHLNLKYASMIMYIMVDLALLYIIQRLIGIVNLIR